MGFIISLIIFLVFQWVFDIKSNPWLRFALLPMVVALYRFKPAFDKYLEIDLKNIKWQKTIKILAILVVTFRVFQMPYKLSKKNAFTDDIPLTYEKAINYLFKEGKNPYVQRDVDLYRIKKNEADPNSELVTYHGLKYPPMQILLYAPSVLVFGLKGIHISNFFAFWFTIGLIFFCLKKSINQTYAYLGVFLILLCDYYFILAFNNATNDYWSSFFSFLAIVLFQLDKKKLSGIVLGLSIASKQIPGAFVAIYLLLQGEFLIFLIASGVFWLACLPFVIWSPKEFFRLLFLFPIKRPTGALSAMNTLPLKWQSLFGMPGNLSPLVALGYKKFKRLSLKKYWDLPCWGLVFFLLFAKMTPTHYFVWMMPYFILWLLIPFERDASKVS